MTTQNAAYHRAWRKKNPTKAAANCKRWKENNRDTWENCRLRTTYGITLENKRATLAAQQYECANRECRDKLSMRSAYVDHNHTTGQVRGLLCRPCNLSAGQVKDNARILRGLSEYLERTNCEK